MTIAPIADNEAGSSVRTKLNAAIDGVNTLSLSTSPIIFTSSVPGIIHAVEYETVDFDGDVISGIKVTNLSTNTSELTAYSTGDAAIYAGYWPYSAVLSSLDMSNLQAILCTVDVGNFPGLTSWDLGLVVYITGDITGTATGLMSLDLGSLKALYGTFTATFSDLTSLNLSSLEMVAGGTLSVPLLTSIDLSSLVTAPGGGFGIFAAVATTLDLSALENVGGILGFTVPQLVTLDLPAIKYLRGGFGISVDEGPLLQNFSMNSGLLLCGGDFTLNAAALSQASVNGVLIRLAALDGTGGTTTYDNHTIDLSGGTSASPSGAGLTAKATLEGRGCTVTVN